jgi:hypothetical protein
LFEETLGCGCVECDGAGHAVMSSWEIFGAIACGECERSMLAVPTTAQ